MAAKAKANGCGAVSDCIASLTIVHVMSSRIRRHPKLGCRGAQRRLGVALRAWVASTGSAVTHARDSDMCNEHNVNVRSDIDVCLLRALCNRHITATGRRGRGSGPNRRSAGPDRVTETDRPTRPNRPIKDPYVYLSYFVDTALALRPFRVGSYTRRALGSAGTRLRGSKLQCACAGTGAAPPVLSRDTLKSDSLSAH